MKMINIGLFITLLSACTDAGPLIERNSRLKADSIFQIELIALDAEMDSLCNIKYNSGYQEKLDSLVERRRMEIIQLQQGL